MTRAFEVKQKTFFQVSQVLSFRFEKQTSKNVADTTFNNISYKQIDGVAMGSPLGPSLANAFLAHHEQNWLESCTLEYRPSYYWRYVDDMFVLFKSSDHLKRFQSYSNSCHVNMPFTIESDQNKNQP